MSTRIATQSETEIQRAIIAALRRLGFWVVRCGRQKRRGSTQAESLEDGFPDLLVLLGNDEIGLGEVKRPGDKLRPTQAEWHARAAKSGYSRVAIWESSADALCDAMRWRREVLG